MSRVEGELPDNYDADNWTDDYYDGVDMGGARAPSVQSSLGYSDPLWGYDADDFPDTTLGWALADAERSRAEREAMRLAAEALLAAEIDLLHVYVVENPPEDPRMYEGTGIGCLYGLPGSDGFLADLGDWKLLPRGAR